MRYPHLDKSTLNNIDLTALREMMFIRRRTPQPSSLFPPLSLEMSHTVRSLPRFYAAAVHIESRLNSFRMDYMQQLIPQLLRTEPTTISRERYARIAAGMERLPFINIPCNIVRMLLATPPFYESVFSSPKPHDSVPQSERSKCWQQYTDGLVYVHENELTAHLGISAGQLQSAIDTANAESHVTLIQPQKPSTPMNRIRASRIRQMFINDSELIPIYVCTTRSSVWDLYADCTRTWFEFKNLSSRLQGLQPMYRAGIDAHLRGAGEVLASTAKLSAVYHYESDAMSIITQLLV